MSKVCKMTSINCQTGPRGPSYGQVTGYVVDVYYIKRIRPNTEFLGAPVAASATCKREPLTLTWKERDRR